MMINIEHVEFESMSRKKVFLNLRGYPALLEGVEPDSIRSRTKTTHANEPRTAGIYISIDGLTNSPLTALQKEGLINFIISEAVVLSIQKSNTNNVLKLFNS